MPELILCESVCETCGGEIWAQPKKDGSPRKRRFCNSQPCTDSRRAKETCLCGECGKVYSKRIRKGSGDCCSVKCSAKRAARAVKVRYKRLRAGLCERTNAEILWSIVQPEVLALRRIAKNQQKNIEGAFDPIRFAICKWCGDVMPPGQKSGSCCDGECARMMTCAYSWARNSGGYRDTDSIIREYRRAMRERPCEVCGSVFSPYTSISKYCSKECSTKAYKQSDKYKAHRRTAKHMRRARKYANGKVQKIDPLDIFDRDGWRCHVCGTYTPKKMRGTCEDRSPELDHVIPLAAGGTHTEDNVKCCCRACNLHKGATIYQEDMFIGRRHAQTHRPGEGERYNLSAS